MGRATCTISLRSLRRGPLVSASRSVTGISRSRGDFSKTTGATTVVGFTVGSDLTCPTTRGTVRCTPGNIAN